VPVIELLVLVRTSLIVLPEPETAPVILPVIVPIVHEKLLGTLAVRLILGPAPLHTLVVAAFVTVGCGFTATETVLPADTGLIQPDETNCIDVMVTMVVPWFARPLVLNVPVPAAIVSGAVVFGDVLAPEKL
jgi:hypothetical protein